MPSSILRCNGQTRRGLNLQPRCSGAMFLRACLSPFQHTGDSLKSRGSEVLFPSLHFAIWKILRLDSHFAVGKGGGFAVFIPNQQAAVFIDTEGVSRRFSASRNDRDVFSHHQTAAAVVLQKGGRVAGGVQLPEPVQKFRCQLIFSIGHGPSSSSSIAPARSIYITIAKFCSSSGAS